MKIRTDIQKRDQDAHGFSQFEAVCYNVNNANYQKAYDGDLDCRGIIMHSYTNYFYAIESGHWYIPAHGKATGLWYVQANGGTQGGLTQTDPTGSSRPIMDVLDVDNIIVWGAI